MFEICLLFWCDNGHHQLSWVADQIGPRTRHPKQQFHGSTTEGAHPTDKCQQGRSFHNWKLGCNGNDISKSWNTWLIISYIHHGMGSNLGTPKHVFVVEGSSWRWTKCLLRFEFRSMTSFNQEIASSRIACQHLKCPGKKTVASLYQHRYTVCTPATEVPWRRGSTANRGLAPFAW